MTVVSADHDLRSSSSVGTVVEFSSCVVCGFSHRRVSGGAGFSCVVSGGGEECSLVQ